jgi:hypothetical protein
MGEPSKRALNSSCVIVIHSIRRGPSSPSRAKERGLARRLREPVPRADFLGDVSTFPFLDRALDRTTDGASEAERVNPTR